MGARLKWACPAADPGIRKDGLLIDNPPRTSPMVYDGLDGELYSFGAAHASTAGLTKGMAIPHTWLVYAYGHTTRCVLAGSDVLTGFMSGCVIAQWSERGTRYVGHVGTVESDVRVNTAVKRGFVDAMRGLTQTRGFNPAGAWQYDEIAALMRKFKSGATPRIVALVTTGGDFYSILLFQLQQAPNEYCVGGIKSVVPLNHDALCAYLTR